jgi:hypothetical protein
VVNTALQTASIGQASLRTPHYFELTITENSVSVGNNTSSVSWALKLSCESGNWDWNFANNVPVKYTVTIDGSDYTGNVMKYDGRSTVTVGSGTVTVGHGTNGEKTLDFGFEITSLSYSYLPQVGSKSGSMELTTIPKLSQPSLVTWPEHTQDVGDFGTTISIHMNRQSSEFTHTVRYAYGDLTGTIATNVTTGTKWTIPLSFMDLIPDNLSGSGTVYVDTYDKSGNMLGTRWCGFTATVPASVKPTCSIQVLDATDIKDNYGNLVKGLSKLYVKTTGKGAYGSTIKSYEVIANGTRYTEAEITTGVLANAGTVTVSAVVTDSRGRKSAEALADFSVLDYNKPTISSLTVHRCNQDGTTNNRGEYIKAIFSAEVTNPDGANTDYRNVADYTLEYKKTSENDNAWKTITLSDYTGKDQANTLFVVDERIIFPASSDSAYNVRVTVSDRHYSTSRSTTTSTAFTLVHYNKDGNGLSFGEVDDEPETLTNALALRQGGNRYAYQANAFSGNKGYTALAVISIKELNANAPITFVLNKRGMDCPMTCHIRFVSSSSTTDPALDSFVYEGDNYGAFLVKTSTSTWTLYVDNTGGWSNPCVLDWYTSKNNGARISVAFPDEQIASLPDPFYRATPMVTQSILDCFMPVGYILLLYSHADPNTMYPGTTWVRIQNAFLWAVDGSGTIGQTGGAKEVTLTAEQIPAHNHGGTYTNAGSTTKTHAWLTSGGSAMAYDTVDAGGGKAHNNMPPYVQVSVWRRTV